jgi:hypothetical protein
MNVVTRFAPSPTGYLHIGGARTALFNWLFARHHGGTYLLRIEDTDKARSTDAAIAAIHDGLDWLGLGGDKPAISQSAQSERHQEIAHALIAAGAAYQCYLTDDELTAIREDSKKTGKAVRSPWRDRDPAQAPADASYVVRMKMPDSGSTTIADVVQGSVTVQNHVLDDMVILRADGSPTYMLAVVVDDHDMGITHFGNIWFTKAWDGTFRSLPISRLFMAVTAQNCPNDMVRLALMPIAIWGFYPMRCLAICSGLAGAMAIWISSPAMTRLRCLILAVLANHLPALTAINYAM